jgi:AcrR family transcriptional regulator
MAAVELVIRAAGMEGATVRAIAERAGVSVGTVYRRFPNKRALMLCAQERFLAYRAERLTMGLRFAGRRRAPSALTSAVRPFIARALSEIERDRPLLLAFARPARADAEIHRAFSELGADADALDVLLTALRGHVLDSAFPSGRTLAHATLTRHMAKLVVGG